MAANRFPETEITEYCLSHWGKKPEEITYPGGEGRKTVLVRVDGTRYAISKRSSKDRAALEAEVLSKLAPTGGVPRLEAIENTYVVQEFVAGERLTLALETSKDQARIDLLLQAASSLLRLQKQGAETGLLRRVPKIGARPGWALDFAASPLRLANELDIALDKFAPEVVTPYLATENTAFVKWDARPGNAVLSGNDIIWFDWEHCGAGSIEDDLVWLMADEWTPDLPEAEKRALVEGSQQSGVAFDRLADRFYTKAVLHSTIRLGLIFRRKGDGGWWNPAEALVHDRVGVTRAHVQRVCRRASRWAGKTNEMEVLRPLFASISRKAEQM